MHTLACGVSCCPLAMHVASYGGGTSMFMVMLEDTWGALIDECGACRQECQGALPTFLFILLPLFFYLGLMIHIGLSKLKGVL